MSTTSTWSPTRTVDGVVLPGAATWAIDPGHADVAFTGRHLMLTKVRGRFQDVRGSITVGESMNDSTVDVTIGMTSVESGSSARDEHLRSSELFDVENFHEATFRSVGVDWRGDGGVVHGDLTIHGTTRRVPLHVTFEGYVRDPSGADRAIFSAETKVNREDFGITWNVALEAGGVLVSKEVTITIDIETVLT
jgi:polyisoprenoid-binding protein YceI